MCSRVAGTLTYSVISVRKKPRTSATVASCECANSRSASRCSMTRAETAVPSNTTAMDVAYHAVRRRRMAFGCFTRVPHRWARRGDTPRRAP
jgi:hypothetical protein